MSIVSSLQSAMESLQIQRYISQIMIIVAILLFFSCVYCNDTSSNKDRLIHAQVIFRHGDRTILKTYANDPYKDKIHWPEGFGQLTNSGKLREYSLGLFLRRRYDKFIGPYSPDEISILSSNWDRTINSANLVLAGMFPPNEDQTWNEEFLWQPIAVHSIPLEMDYFIDAESACARYLEAREEYSTTKEITDLIKQNQKLFDYLEANAGQPVRTLTNLKDIHEALDIEHQTNKTLPEWSRKVYKPNGGGTLEYLKTYWIKFITGTPELKRLKAGFILQMILDRFTNKTLSLLPDEKMRLLSGHDITIASILNALGVFELHTPPYSSSLMFELYESNADNSHYIQIFYRNTTAENLMPLKIPNCGTKCSLNHFYELYNDVLASDYKAECRLTSN